MLVHFNTIESDSESHDQDLSVGTHREIGGKWCSCSKYNMTPIHHLLLPKFEWLLATSLQIRMCLTSLRDLFIPQSKANFKEEVVGERRGARGFAGVVIYTPLVTTRSSPHHQQIDVIMCCSSYSSTSCCVLPHGWIVNVHCNSGLMNTAYCTLADKVTASAFWALTRFPMQFLSAYMRCKTGLCSVCMKKLSSKGEIK